LVAFSVWFITGVILYPGLCKSSLFAIVNYFSYKHSSSIVCDARTYGMRYAANRKDLVNSEVVIIGGGVASLTTAALLARSGKAEALREHAVAPLDSFTSPIVKS
jgi:hypothetical protein